MTLKQIETAVQQTVQDALFNLAEMADEYEGDCPVSEQAEESIRDGVQQLYWDQVGFRQKDELDLKTFRALFGPLLEKPEEMTELEAYREKYGPFVSYEDC